MNTSWYNMRMFILFYGIIFLTILYKGLNVPITHDEVSTIFMAKNESIWNIITYKNPIPNNHILNTLLTKLSLFLFGMNHFSVRLPNLIAFIVYGTAIYQLLKKVIGLQSWFYVPASLFFISNLYLLDFFGLSRGYALSISLCVLSILYIISAFQEMSSIKNNWAIFFAILSAYSNFTLIYYLVILLLLSTFFLYNQYIIGKLKVKYILHFIAFILLFLVLAVIPIQNMTSTGQFQFWSNNGFVDETVQPLIVHSLYDSKVLFFQFSNFFLILIYIVITFAIAWSIRFLLGAKKKIEVFNSPFFIASFILIGIITVNILHVYLTDVPNLKNRTALFYFPLFILVFISAINSIKLQLKQWLKITLSTILSILCILQITLNFKPDSVREWAYDSNTLQVIDFISNESDVNVILTTDWKFNPSFYYYARNNQLNNIVLNPYSKKMDVNSGADYYYIFENDFELFEKKYRIVKEFRHHTILIKKCD